MPPPSTKDGEGKKKLSGWKHSAAGSLGGMTGAIVTSPFDVVKTRLQSDMFKHHNISLKGKEKATLASAGTPSTNAAVAAVARHQRGGVSGAMWQFVDTAGLIRRIGVEEGWRALFKGLGPTLVGIIPARAINFYFYPTTKAYLARTFPNAPVSEAGQTSEDSPVVHLGAAVVAGIMTATGTNPIWVVKTRLQLSARKKHISPTFYSPTSTSTPSTSPLPRPIAASAAALASSTSPSTRSATTSTATPKAANAISTTLHIFRTEGIRGLYRGLSASYLGVSEGVIQWVVYERLKRLARPTQPGETQSAASFVGSVVGASAGAKGIASLITYPHEVIRTRLRQPAPRGQPKKYTGLVQTLKLVMREEGAAALYGGLTAHMLRVIPNAAVLFGIYELVAMRLGE